MTAGITKIEVEAGAIFVSPSLSDLPACSRIPGGKWNARRKVWAFAATSENAALLKRAFRLVRTTPAFEELLAPEAVAEPESQPASVPCLAVQPHDENSPAPATVGSSTLDVRLPEELLTRPWGHQIAAFEFCLAKFAAGMHGILLAMGMGCIEGDAEVIINRRRCARRITLREFHRKFHGGESRGRKWRDFPTRTRSIIGGELRLNEVLDVIAQGVKPVVRVTLASGKSIRVTPDHEFARPDGAWTEAGKLAPGDVVLTNGTPVCKLCGGTRRVTTYRYAKHVGVCRGCIGRARGRKGKVIDKDGYVRLYGMDHHPRANKAGQVYEHIVVMERVLGRPITVCEHVHHKNHIRHDNRPENLEVLPATEHQQHHGAHGGYIHLDSPKVHFIPKADTVVSVEPDGETDVYDIRMAAPGHNFVANGIIVHNCGKSLVLWWLILHLRARRVMIICPLRVAQVWRSECERHVGAPVVIVTLDEAAGSVAKKMELAEQKMRLAETMGVPFVCVINYDSGWREPFASWAEKIRWDLIGADEAHRAKAPGGKASLWLKRLRKVAAYRVALTGTPMPHSPLDVYAIFRFLDITIFGPAFSPFRARFACMGGYQNKQVVGYQKLDELEALMSRITFRVGPEVLDLPPTVHVTYYCELSPEARRIYKDLDSDFVAEYLSGRITASNALAKLTKLAQLANGIVKNDQGIEHRIDSTKQKLLTDTLEDIGKDEPVVVFCRFHLDLDAVHEASRARGFTSLELSGRRDELKQWQDGGAQVLAVQISAGGVGVNLTRARYCIYYSVSFSLGDYEQSEKRVHRPGQNRPVEYIHLLARNTVDEKIARALKKRADVVESILAEIKN